RSPGDRSLRRRRQGGVERPEAPRRLVARGTAGPRARSPGTAQEARRREPTEGNPRERSGNSNEHPVLKTCGPGRITLPRPDTCQTFTLGPPGKRKSLKIQLIASRWGSSTISRSFFEN